MRAMQKQHDDIPDETQKSVAQTDEVAKLQEQLAQAQESERRAIADYKNLVRRTQEDRVKMAKLAALSVIESILQPLEHLYLAQEQLKDKGLQMVYQQFIEALRSEGVEEIDVMGKEFDPHAMEVVEKQAVDDEKQVGKIVKVLSRGYRLNNEVIRHAKVVVGEMKK